MDETHPGFAFCSKNINFGTIASWASYDFPNFSSNPSFTCSTIITLLTLLLPLLAYWAIANYNTTQVENKGPFRFMDLPRELRDLVYEHMIEDPAYPPPASSPSTTSTMNWMTLRRWPTTSTKEAKPQRSNWILLANKQIYNEYTQLLCKRAVFHLTISPENYDAHNPPAVPTTRYQPTQHLPPRSKLWKISPSTLSHLRHCSLKLVTTSAMLGVLDPRNMTSLDWTLASLIRHELAALKSVQTLTLDAKAIGDPLWNPLWIWYHASQSLKNMGTSPSDTGPKLNRITFSLDTWSPGENYLERDGENGMKGVWTWFCMKGHKVDVDGGAEMTVREFCGKLYQDCRVCRPEAESESESEGEAVDMSEDDD